MQKKVLQGPTNYGNLRVLLCLSTSPSEIVLAVLLKIALQSNQDTQIICDIRDSDSLN